MINTIDGRNITSEQHRIECEDHIKDKVGKAIREAVEYMECELEECYITWDYKNDNYKVQVSIV